MDRISFLAVFFIVCVVADVSDAASSLSKRRILIGEPQTDNKTAGKGKEDSPVPSPLLPPTVSNSGGSGSDTKPVDDPSKEKTPKPKVDQGPKVGLNSDTKISEGKDAETEKKDPEHARTSNEDPKPETDKMSKDNPREDTDKVSKDNPKEKDNPNANEKKDTPKRKDTPKEKQKEESCAGVTKIKTCAVKDVAVACIKSFSSGSKVVGILVQNLRNSTSKATLSTNGTSKDLEIPKQQNRKVNISIDPGKRTSITLNAGTGECKLHIDPLPLAFLSLKTIATPSVEFKAQRLK